MYLSEGDVIKFKKYSEVKDATFEKGCKVKIVKSGHNWQFKASGVIVKGESYPLKRGHPDVSNPLPIGSLVSFDPYQLIEDRDVVRLKR